MDEALMLKCAMRDSWEDLRIFEDNELLLEAICSLAALWIVDNLSVVEEE